VQDVPDLRDWPFEPSLNPLKRYVTAPRGLSVLNQHSEGACTGFGLAAVINLLNQQRGSKTRVSARMLYEMARLHDEWPGEGYSGSSCRGAIKGWYNMGVCSERAWPYVEGKPGNLTLKRAKAARDNTVGAYYRVQPEISHFHAALNEVGAIFCSAKTHAGWQQPNRNTGVITHQADNDGGHAFAIVGYNSKGFWIQNSWGRQWGRNGLGLWLYEDWLENLMDAWVFNLAVPTPQIWHLPQTSERNRSGGFLEPSPARSEIAGHFLHVDDGDFHDRGRYWSDDEDVRITASAVAGGGQKYRHLLLYAHGGLNSPKASARRIAAMKQTFKANGIYPYHFMYDTGILEEIKDVVLRRGSSSAERAGSFTNWTDQLLERATRIPGRALWREMKGGARLPFQPDRAGSQALATWLTEMARADSADLKVHICGHSTGAILLAHLLETLEDLAPTLRIHSCTLFAPAATLDLFHSHYYPYLVAPTDAFGIDRMQVFNLNDRLERDDHVFHAYRKSLLYLVSQAFEEDTPARLLGLYKDLQPELAGDKFAAVADRFDLHLADGSDNGITTSTSHGGFDNDANTMNSLLRAILGEQPRHPFTKATLDY
jgi:hypothetical protein